MHFSGYTTLLHIENYPHCLYTSCSWFMANQLGSTLFVHVGVWLRYRKKKGKATCTDVIVCNTLRTLQAQREVMLSHCYKWHLIYVGFALVSFCEVLNGPPLYIYRRAIFHLRP